MSEVIYNFVSLDLVPLLISIFIAATCALLGNFLVLRKISLVGDAISHSVLPGIVAAFILFDSRQSLVVFLGALVAGVLATLLVEAIRHFGQMSSGAAMGVVFSLFFALGVALMEQAAARNVDLDVDCLLYGQLESIFWFPPHEFNRLLSVDTFLALPGQLWSSLLILVFVSLFIWIFFKELKLSAFDPALATALGFSARLIHVLLMVFVAGAVVASFQAVGSILVIGMLICPAAAARLLTDSLKWQIVGSLLIAIIASTLGYVLGAFAPWVFGIKHALSASGAMIVALGCIFATVVILAPRYGLLGRAVRNMLLSIRIISEDLLGQIYRYGEDAELSLEGERGVFGNLAVYGRLDFWSRIKIDILRRLALWRSLRSGMLICEGGFYKLSDAGRDRAKSIVRSHRLWESYLVSKVGLKKEKVHASATELEHFTSDELLGRLEVRQNFPKTDPHGREIPTDNNQKTKNK